MRVSREDTQKMNCPQKLNTKQTKWGQKDSGMQKSGLAIINFSNNDKMHLNIRILNFVRTMRCKNKAWVL